MLEEFGHLQVGDVLATVSVEPRDPDTHYQESDWQHECAESEVKQLEQDFLDGVHATNAGVGRVRPFFKEPLKWYCKRRNYACDCYAKYMLSPLSSHYTTRI
ncbi:jg6337 [Pararge aegeria aegeria]|uniref:Jg6337 protein n=1 Tax=Pararge aegeria aegeria TaxID=348720 RepID=A0A8S4RP85_9NEOP|nr:jg6337 [Pararge aegeria aegeria]